MMTLSGLIELRQKKYKKEPCSEYWEGYKAGWYWAYQDLKEILEQNGFDMNTVVINNDITNNDVEHGHWIYWDGWIGNTVQRIDDAVCSKCGYKHPPVWRTERDKPNSTPNKLADICPNCNAVMKKE